MNLINKLEKMQEKREKNLEDIARKSGRDIKTINNDVIQMDIFKAQMDNLQAEIDYFSK